MIPKWEASSQGGGGLIDCHDDEGSVFMRRELQSQPSLVHWRITLEWPSVFVQVLKDLNLI